MPGIMMRTILTTGYCLSNKEYVRLTEEGQDEDI